ATPVINCSGSGGYLVIMCPHNDLVLRLARKPADYVGSAHVLHRLLHKGWATSNTGKKFFDLFFTLLVLWQTLPNAFQNDGLVHQRELELLAKRSPSWQAKQERPCQTLEFRQHQWRTSFPPSECTPREHWDHG